MDTPLKIIETEEGPIIEIHYDTDPPNPRREDVHLGHMICFHRRYSLGDKHSFDSSITPEEIIKEEGPCIFMPLYLYDHSGITMSTGAFGDPWDSGCVGFIYTSYKDIRAWYKCKLVTKKILEQAKQELEREVADYDQFISETPYGYILKDRLGKRGKELDEGSVWGFYGDQDEIEEIAKEALLSWARSTNFAQELHFF